MTGQTIMTENKHAHSHESEHGGCRHSHGHAHAHAVPVDNHNRAFIVAVALNTGFVVAEFAYGVIANSTALMADAGHNLSDVLGLLLAWAAAILAKTAPGGRFTYGLRSSSILAALGNAILLLVACGAIAWEAIQRFSEPPPVAGLTVMVIALAGVIVNGVSAWLFAKGSKSDLNIRAAYLHLLADAAVSVGVAVTGILMFYSGWNWLDPVVSLAIVGVIVAGTWSMLKESLALALNAVPPHIDVPAIEQYLRACSGVTDIHDLHIWAMSTTESALTAHLVIPGGYPGDNFMDEIAQKLESRFSIHHSTLQVEQGTTSHSCRL